MANSDDPFISLTDAERSILSELAFGIGNGEIEEELSERRDFGRERTSDFRVLVGAALDTGAAERNFDEDEVEALYDRLTESLYPESS